MHEGHFTEQIVEGILSELAKRSIAHASEVRVRVGEMHHLNAESVIGHFKVLTQSTALEGTKLVLNEEAVKIKCGACGAEGGVDDHHLLVCRVCGDMDVTLLAGNEVVVESIEYEADAT